MLIIGLGNLDRGDDAAGLLVARGLLEKGISAIAHNGDPMDLIEILTTAECTVLVDAVVTGGAYKAQPGTLHIWDARESKLRNKVFRSSTHALGLAEALELARTLDRLPKQLTVYGIEAARFGAGTPPSIPVLAGVEKAVARIASSLASRGFPS